MLQKVKKAIAGIIAVVTVASVVFPVFVMTVQANETSNAEEIPLSNQELIEPNYIPAQYTEQEKRSQEALEVIAEKYAENDSLIIEGNLSSEDEARVEQAVSEYLSLVGFNPLMPRFGRNWWNSVNFVGTVIDVALIAIGLWGTGKSVAVVRNLIRNNRRNITRVVESAIMKRIGVGVGGLLLAGIDVALTIASTSLGWMIAKGMDIADRRNDGYIYA